MTTNKKPFASRANLLLSFPIGMKPLTPSQITRLLTAARAARRHAYAPYSGFLVGAAILTATGRIYRGVNIENASYGTTICAERSAVACAVGDGQRRFRALAVVGPQSGLTPCGACRQVLAEFGDLPVICGDSRSPRRKPEIFLLSALLPAAFQMSGPGQPS